MKALVVTPLDPPVQVSDQAGAARRFGRFLSALGNISDDIRIAYIATPAAIEQCGDGIAEELSALTGSRVSLSCIPRRTRAANFWNHYVSGMADASERPAMQAFCGPDQVHAVDMLLSEKPDIVFAHRLSALVTLLKCHTRPTKMFFDLDDVEHRVLYRDIVRPPLWPGKLAYLLHIPALMHAERQGIARSELTFVCSQEDKKHLRKFADGQKIFIIPNTADVPAAPPGVAKTPSILFLGTFQYLPNVDAAERLITRILPLIRSKVPDAYVMIAGNASDNIPARHSNPANVQFLGFVPDLNTLYQQARLVCCPLMVGGGTRIKLIEAAAQARPIVSTRVGAEGLEFRDEEEVLLKESDQDIAEACVRLLQSDHDCSDFGLRARHRMLELYKPQDVINMIERSIRNAL